MITFKQLISEVYEANHHYPMKNTLLEMAYKKIKKYFISPTAVLVSGRRYDEKPDIISVHRSLRAAELQRERLMKDPLHDHSSPYKIHVGETEEHETRSGAALRINELAFDAIPKD